MSKQQQAGTPEVDFVTDDDIIQARIETAINQAIQLVTDLGGNKEHCDKIAQIIYNIDTDFTKEELKQLGEIED